MQHKVHQNHPLFLDVNVDQDHFDNVFVVLLLVFVFVLIHIEFDFEMHLVNVFTSRLANQRRKYFCIIICLLKSIFESIIFRIYISLLFYLKFQIFHPLFDIVVVLLNDHFLLKHNNQVYSFVLIVHWLFE